MQYSITFTVATLFASLTVAAPANRVPFVTDKNIVGLPQAPVEPLEARQNNKACFITGNAQLPAEVATVVQQLGPKVKCNAAVKTLGGVPDVTSGGQTYSKIDFSKATSGLQFALDTFVTADNMADSNLQAFQDALDVYTATEAGLRSSGGNFNTIKAPKFFLAMQIARIKTAQGNAPTDAANQVDHLAEKVTKNAGRVDASLIAKVNALAKQT
ncbi:hypothetical protein PG990_003182 [Apiospora arundinis]|uniref:DUF7143 domain-containing protein n=1 Tax=Apiospora arundinis TaxID=335852 RepID=A0ABR2IGM2_9PEZI